MFELFPDYLKLIEHRKRMPQEFQVVRCFSCQTFQGQQVKKAKKWRCKVCGEKQSYCKVYGQGNGKECRLHVQKLNEMAANMQQGLEEEVERGGDFQDDHNDASFDDGDGRGGGGGVAAAAAAAAAAEKGPPKPFSDGAITNKGGLSGRWQRYLDEQPSKVEGNVKKQYQPNEGPSKHDTIPSVGFAAKQYDVPRKRRLDCGEVTVRDAAILHDAQHDDDESASSNCYPDRFEEVCHSDPVGISMLKKETKSLPTAATSGRAELEKTPSSTSWAPDRAASASALMKTRTNTSTAQANVSRWSKYLEPEEKISKQVITKENLAKIPRLSDDSCEKYDTTKSFQNSPSKGDRRSLGIKGGSSSTNVFPEMSDSEWNDLFEDF